MNPRIALVGCGAIAPSHIDAILTNRMQVCALCDIDRTHAEELIAKFALANVEIYTDYTEMLQAARPDVVHICTPHDLHAPMSIAALRRGIHVLCEKPLCITQKQLTELREAASRSSARLGVCHQNRYEPNMIRLKELCSSKVTAGMGDVVWERDASYYNSAAWRGTWKQEGGGAMINQALHTLDLMQWVCGMPDRVTAHIATDVLKNIIETEDTAIARFSCPDGAVFHFFATVGSHSNFKPLLRIHLESGDSIMAEKESIIYNGVLSSVPPQKECIGKAEWGMGHRALIADFYGCIQTGTHFAIDLEEAAKVVRMILAMYHSNGEEITVE